LAALELVMLRAMPHLLKRLSQVDVPLGQSLLQWDKLMATTMAPILQHLGG